MTCTFVHQAINSSVVATTLWLQVNNSKQRIIHPPAKHSGTRALQWHSVEHLARQSTPRQLEASWGGAYLHLRVSQTRAKVARLLRTVGEYTRDFMEPAARLVASPRSTRRSTAAASRRAKNAARSPASRLAIRRWGRRFSPVGAGARLRFLGCCCGGGMADGARPFSEFGVARVFLSFWRWCPRPPLWLLGEEPERFLFFFLLFLLFVYFFQIKQHLKLLLPCQKKYSYRNHADQIY